MRQSLPAPVNLRRQSHNALIGALTRVVFIAAGTFGPAANRIALIMIGRVNKVVTPSERVCYFGKDISFRRKFKQLYPGDRVALWPGLSVGLFFACFLAGVWIFGLRQ